LKLKKGMYGLADAPALWSLSLRWFLTVHLGGKPSHHDENFFIWRDSNGKITGAATAHVDDTNNAGLPKDLDHRRNLLEKRFGKLSRQLPPFQHVGLTIERLADGGYKLHQSEFAKALKIIRIDRGRSNEEALNPSETTQLRGALGGLLYLTYTRPDISADVVMLQTRVNQALISDLRKANAIIRRAWQNPDFGLCYPKLEGPVSILAVSDASFSTKSTSYAIEGTAVFLRPRLPDNVGTASASAFSSYVHMLAHHSGKAKRISHSTSHAESLAHYSVLTQAEQVAERFTECNAPWHPTLDEMINISSQGKYDMPIDSVTDCLDLMELITGSKGCPQDRGQRLIVLSLRERRLLGKTRSCSHCVTTDMVCNSLTKHDDSAQLRDVLTTGYLKFSQMLQHRPMSDQARKHFSKHGYEESTLLNMTNESC